MESMCDQDLENHIGMQPSALQESLSAYTQVVHMAVNPSAGTGGKSHADTKAIMEMRRQHPLIWRLVDAVRVVDHG